MKENGLISFGPTSREVTHFKDAYDTRTQNFLDLATRSPKAVVSWVMTPYRVKHTKGSEVLQNRILPQHYTASQFN